MKSLKILLGCLAFGLLVLVHEAGHFAVGTLLGIPAKEFSVGFGPEVVGIDIGQTHYRLSALPLGGYVEFDPHALGVDSTTNSASNAPRSVTPVASNGAKILMVLAGPLSNFALAYIVFFIGILGLIRYKAQEVLCSSAGDGSNMAGMPNLASTLILTFRSANVAFLRFSKILLEMVASMLLLGSALKQLSGPLSIVMTTSGESSPTVTVSGNCHPWCISLFVLGGTSLFIGVFNLLPLYPFDGGRILLSALDAIGIQLPPSWLTGYEVLGLGMLLIFVTFALCNDLRKLFAKSPSA